MSYTALYRKFRPVEFEDVKGQEHIVTTLKNEIKTDRIGHAYLFCGTRGTGKTTVAKILARAVNCENPVDGSPCNECAMCRKINSQTSMNVIEIDAASNNGVANIRDIIDEVQYSPTEGKYKVYIIDEVHMLSTGAFNALLKTLEEPPEYVIFILATTEAHKIPITILSRCQRYDFRRISIDTIAERLRELVDKENVEAEEKALRYVAKAADGSLRDALSLLDQCIAFYLGQKLTYDNVLDVLGAVDTQVYSKMFNFVVAGDVIGCVSLIDEMMTAGRDINQFVNEFIWYIRNLMLISVSENGKDIVDVSTEQFENMLAESKKVDADVLMRYIRILSELSNQLRYSAQKRVLSEIVFIRLCKPQMDTEQDMSAIISRIEALENKIEQGIVVRNDSVADNVAVSVEKTEEKKAVIIPKAVAEDVKEVIRNWQNIVHQCARVEQTMLFSAKKVASDDGELILQFTNPIDEGYFTQDNGKNLESLKTIITNMTGKDIEITTRTVAKEMDEQFVDLSDSIKFDIEYK